MPEHVREEKLGHRWVAIEQYTCTRDWLACAPQKVDPVLIMRFRPAMLGCFAPIDLTTGKKGRH